VSAASLKILLDAAEQPLAAQASLAASNAALQAEVSALTTQVQTLTSAVRSSLKVNGSNGHGDLGRDKKERAATAHGLERGAQRRSGDSGGRDGEKEGSGTGVSFSSSPLAELRLLSDSHLPDFGQHVGKLAETNLQTWNSYTSKIPSVDSWGVTAATAGDAFRKAFSTAPASEGAAVDGKTGAIALENGAEAAAAPKKEKKEGKKAAGLKKRSSTKTAGEGGERKGSAATTEKES